ncbi:DUF192 domain-containing protein [Salinirubrum litoreum]|uniref:DUF192 domain-containing protein n=1 Tax=Salinirubrum litoreum TaxID=1126234 RepID=A0ABD5RD38_9EURY|nr:DUF192 domain-containing protein [Salinirubrum litoreum]
MDSRTAAALAAILLVSVGGVAAFELGFVGSDGYDRTTVTVEDESGQQLATVEVRVSDTFDERYTGLSDTESLGPNEGMLFVHGEESRKTYVMRDMAFPIDMVFVAANGTVTRIHHAELPPEGTSEGDLKGYTGQAKYVLEVPYEFTTENGIEVGDRLVIPDEHRNP